MLASGPRSPSSRLGLRVRGPRREHRRALDAARVRSRSASSACGSSSTSRRRDQSLGDSGSRNTAIWKGGDPLPGQVKFTFWHVMFFAWFCNMAMHIGMSDLSVFRFARKSWYGLATASGMFLGHYIAWIAASILYACSCTPTRQTPPCSRARSPTTRCGVAGLICVIVAGWTTANPTIYRAGLAFQAIMPRASTLRVTLATGRSRPSPACSRPSPCSSSDSSRSTACC